MLLGLIRHKGRRRPGARGARFFLKTRFAFFSPFLFLWEGVSREARADENPEDEPRNRSVLPQVDCNPPCSAMSFTSTPTISTPPWRVWAIAPCDIVPLS